MTKSKKSSQTPLRVLGIDPGYGRMGIAVIEKEDGKETLIYSECFETEGGLPHSKRLVLISEKIEEIIDTWQPKILAVETLLFSKNVKTAIKVAEARGVIIKEGAKKNILIEEINPNSIKLAVTGYGKADKKQIKDMLNMIFKIKNTKKYDDEYDAIAAAFTSSIQLSTKLF